jgi:peroxiredoxin
MKNLRSVLLLLSLVALSQNPARAQRVSQYPNMTLMAENGAVQNARDLPAGSVIIIYFPDCDHCQREAAEISSHLTSFQKHSVWFVSTAALPEIQKFSTQYKLAGYANIHFVRTEMKDVISNFGGIPTPSVFIYSKDKQLVKAIKGETKIEEIIKYL